MNVLWEKIIEEATMFYQSETFPADFIHSSILKQKDFWQALSSILSKKLQNHQFSSLGIKLRLLQFFQENAELRAQVISDLQAYFERDYATETYLEVVLYSRGFQAITLQRIARLYYLEGQKLTAKSFQSRIFEVYVMDIHPMAKLGKGIVIDHGVGVVIGETVEVGDNVFIFHQVTLGGTGKGGGDRHPKIKDDVFIGAGATILGNITVGNHANIAAGSVVLKDVAPNTAVAGIPAKLIGEAKKLQ